jgi:N-methylhydantoinase A/oxoprolinase/acetone carboxylase beta subunit
MVATGGAGPVHACGVAQRLGVERVIVPPVAGVASAFGMLLAPISFDFSRSYVARLAGLDLGEVNHLLETLEAEGRRIVAAAGVAEAEMRVVRAADMRYVGQGFEIRAPVPSGLLTEEAYQQLQAAFEAEYRRLYGRLCEGVPVQVVHWRVTVSGPSPRLKPVSFGQNGEDPSLKGQRMALFSPDHGPVETPVYNRYTLTPGFTTPGPAIIEEAESTTVVLPGWTVRLDETASLILSKL